MRTREGGKGMGDMDDLLDDLLDELAMAKAAVAALLNAVPDTGDRQDLARRRVAEIVADVAQGAIKRMKEALKPWM